ncbi:MAG: GNAT family N-acetyltransferase [Xanthomonadales bacterium]|nr:GNAT family N-acetyltransferase [Xanthomonadales bacterium]
MEPLDRPVWSSLTSAHTHLALGDGLALRYDLDVNRFASARDDSGPALAALACLVRPHDPIYILQVPEIHIPQELVAVKQALCVQMVASAPATPDGTGNESIVPLGEADAAEMLVLATLTEPGPFLRGTGRMGNFFGIRIDGRLAAMAGERFRFPGYTEVSGVCTHPDFRGRGLASRLSRHVMVDIAARGDTPFLHAWKTNHTAIALYEHLGFRWRSDVHVAVLERRTPQPA